MNPETTSSTNPKWYSFAVLAIVTAILLLAIGGFGHSRYGLVGLCAAAIAVGLCSAAASLAFVLLLLPLHPFSKSMLSIAARTALPLLGGMMLLRSVAMLQDVPFLGMLTAAYLVMLSTETLLVALQDQSMPTAFRAMLSKKEVL